jgi:hypothetical protein
MAEYERYYSCARELKHVSNLSKNSMQTNMRKMSNYDLGVFAGFLKLYIEQMAVRTPNIRLESKQSVKTVYNTASNILESVISGLATKYISKEIARSEIMTASRMIAQVRASLTKRADGLKQDQITEIKMQGSFTPIALSDLDKYVGKLNEVTEMMKPLIKQYEANNKPSFNLPTENSPPEKERTDIINDPYASPSNYNKYDTGFAKKYHTALQKASKLIKLPPNLGTGEGQTTWGICKLPIWVVTKPSLRTNELDRQGIKYDSLDLNSYILYNQWCLVLVSTNTIEYNEALQRAKSHIRDQMHTDFIYSKEFSSKEIRKPFKFIWLMPKNVQLSHFVISHIGLPFTQELKNFEDLTNNVNVIRQTEQDIKDRSAQRSAVKLEEAKELIEQYNVIKAQIEALAKKAKELRANIKDVTATLKFAKIDLQTSRPNSPEYKRKANALIAMETNLGILNDTLINETKVRSIGLDQRLMDIKKAISNSLKS